MGLPYTGGLTLRVLVTAVWDQILNSAPSLTSQEGKEEENLYGGEVRREEAQALQGWP